MLYSATPEEDSLDRSEYSKKTFAKKRIILVKMDFGNDLRSTSEVKGITIIKRLLGIAYRTDRVVNSRYRLIDIPLLYV